MSPRELLTWRTVPPAKAAFPVRPAFCWLCRCPIRVELPPESIVLCGCCEPLLPHWLQRKINAPLGQGEEEERVQRHYLRHVIRLKMFARRALSN